jgi:heat shock protein HslJ
VALNTQVLATENDEFNIDTENPTVVSITPGDGLLADNDVNPDNFTIAVLYSEDMNTGVAPSISFAPAIATSLTFSSGSWGMDNRTYTATYNVLDGGVTVSGVDITVQNAQDVALNTQVLATENDEFNIDTENPTINSVTAGTPIIDEADLIQEVTINFSEPMSSAPADRPTITFSVGTWTTQGNGTWATTQQWTESFTLTDGNESETNVTIDVENTRDVNGNLQNDYTPEDEFDIDVLNPTVQSIAISPKDLFRDPDVGADVITFTIVYSEPMNTGVNPTVTFSPDVVSSGSLVLSGSSNWSNNTTFQAIYNLTDQGERLRDIDVSVSGAQDLNLNVQVTGSQNDILNLDMDPQVTNLSVNDQMLTDKDARSDVFLVTITYSEPMNTNIAPTLTFSSSDVTNSLILSGTSNWQSNTVYLGYYTLIDQGVTINNIGITVTGGQDAALNEKLFAYSFNNQFSIDTQNPTLVSLSPSTTLINDSTQTFTLTAQFSEAMNTANTTSSLFSFSGSESVLSPVFSSGTWNSDTSYTGNFTLIDFGQDIQNINASIPASFPVIDVNGNEIIAGTVSDLFSVDTKNPVVEISPPSVSETTSGPVRFKIIYKDQQGIRDIRLRPEDIQLETTGNVTADVRITGNLPNERDVSFENIQGIGFLSFSIRGRTARDNSENFALPSRSSDGVLVRKVLTITADDKTISYGDPIPDLTYTISGFLGDDDESVLQSLPVLSTNATQFACSETPVNILFSHPGTDEFYTIETVPGRLTINKRDLSVSAVPAQKVYGDQNPTLRLRVNSGLINGDQLSDIDFPPALSTTATVDSGTGIYPIVFDTMGYDLCYNLIATGDTLTVLPSDLGLSVLDTQVVSTVNPTDIQFRIAETGPFLKANDSLSDLGIPTFVTFDRGNNTFDVVATGLSSPNYNIQIDTGRLTLIDPTTIINQPNDQALCAGDTLRLNVEISGASDVDFQWQFRENLNDDFLDISEVSEFRGVNSGQLVADSVDSAWDGYEFRVLVRSDFGGELISDVATLTVNRTPPVTYIARKGFRMLLSVFDEDSATFQWNMNNEPLEGENEKFYLADLPLNLSRDVYSLEICFDMCCTESFIGQVDDPPFTNPSEGQESTVTISPNPNNGIFSVNWSNPYEGPVEIKVINVFGNILELDNLNKTGNTLNWDVDLTASGDPLNSGIYFVWIRFGESVTSQKLFIRR